MKESFGELYARLHRENYAELETLREKTKKSTTGIILATIGTILFIILNPIFMFVGIFALIIWIVYSSIKKGKQNINIEKREKTYSEVFKEKIVGPIIENAFEQAKYTPKSGISRFEYSKAGYKDDIDRYFSEDLVVAPLRVENEVETFITFSEVHTQKESRDEDGRTTYSTQFHGLAGNFLIPHKLNKKIYIRSNWKVGNWNKNKVKMDMPEFEKIFDVESDDAILTMRILTADVMSEMIDFYRKYKYRFEISIIDDTVHMRLSTGPMFEPSVFKDSMEYKQLEKYYLVLKALVSIAGHIYDTILKLDV